MFKKSHFVGFEGEAKPCPPLFTLVANGVKLGFFNGGNRQKIFYIYHRRQKILRFFSAAFRV